MSTSSLSLKVQNSDTINPSRVELEEGTLILATAILDKAKKKDIKLTVKITSSAGDAKVLILSEHYTLMI